MARRAWLRLAAPLAATPAGAEPARPTADLRPAIWGMIIVAKGEG